MFASKSPLVILDSSSTLNIFGFLKHFSGNTISSYSPAPPVGDLLDVPVSLHQPPRIILRQRRFISRVFEIFFNFILSDEERKKRDLHILIAGIMASIWPDTINDLQKKGWIGSFGKTFWQKTRVRHPYHLRSAFEALISTPKELQTERRALEMILSAILREYKKKISVSRDAAFSFEAEARRFGLMGYRIERQMRYLVAKGELEKSLPIRLTQTPTTCWVRPIAGVEFSVGRRLSPARDPQQ